MTWLELLVGGLAVFRLTRFLTDDYLAGPLRRLIARGPYTIEFIECPWCVSIWISALTILAWWALPPTVWIPAAAFLAWSALASLIAANLDR